MPRFTHANVVRADAVSNAVPHVVPHVALDAVPNVVSPVPASLLPLSRVSERRQATTQLGTGYEKWGPPLLGATGPGVPVARRLSRDYVTVAVISADSVPFTPSIMMPTT